MFGRPRRRLVIAAPADVEVEVVVREAEQQAGDVQVISVQRRRWLWRQRVVVKVQGVGDAIKAFDKKLDRWAWTGGGSRVGDEAAG